MSDTIVSGRLHPITPIRRSWLTLTALGWFVYSQREAIVRFHNIVGYGWMALIAGAFAALITTLNVMSWLRTGFRVTSVDLDFRYGLIRRVERRFSMEHIRTADVSRPLWGRLVGVASVKIATQDDNQEIGYLSRKDADRICATIRQVLHGDAPDTKETGEGVIARVDSRMLALSIILNARMMVKLSVGLPIVLWPYLATEQVWSLALVLPWLRSAWNLTGKAFPAQHGWTVRETESGFQTQRGMFNRDEYTWQRDRITSVTLHQPILWRSRDWVRVEAGVVGYGTSTVLPVATRAQAEKLVAGLLGVESLKVFDDVRPVELRARWCTPFWKACGYSETDSFVAGWKGLFLKQEITVTRMSRVIGVATQQGWWQRRHRVATVKLLLPGGSDVEIVHRDAQEAQVIAASMRIRTVDTAEAAPRIRRIRLSGDTRRRALEPDTD